jgi:hypothetical protein
LIGKLKKTANGGLLYHVLETKKNAYETGPGYQMIDNPGYNGKMENWQQSGADNAMHPPAGLMTKLKG